MLMLMNLQIPEVLPDVLVVQKGSLVPKLLDELQEMLSHCQNANLNISPFM